MATKLTAPLTPGNTRPLFLASCYALFLLPIQSANAASDNLNLQTCLEMQKKEAAEDELNCYRQATQKLDLSSRAFMQPHTHGLAKEWAASGAPLVAYKQNYVLLYSHSSQTNNQPTSPNPLNQVATPSLLDKRDLKFQLSLKHDLINFRQYGTLWFGYTQLSFWQIYDVANSRPLRENNYEPEFIYSLRPGELLHGSVSAPDILNFGVVHQSNGQSNPRSRSWNRVYIQPGLELSSEEERKITLLVRWWRRMKENATNDANPDITNYLGHEDIELRYTKDKNWELTAIAMIRSIQLDWAVPWPSWLTFPASFGEHNTNLHIQYFNGYGENLIDYNQKHHTWGIGVTFPFD